MQVAPLKSLDGDGEKQQMDRARWLPYSLDSELDRLVYPKVLD
jgi:hypothetical protein